MEEKKMNEEQAAEQTASQEENKQVDEMAEYYTALKAENEKLQKQYESEKRSCLRYYRQYNLLKCAIDNLIADSKVAEDDVKRAILLGMSVTSIDDLVYTLTDHR